MNTIKVMDVELVRDICDEVVNFAFNCAYDMAQLGIGIDAFGRFQNGMSEPGRVELKESVAFRH